MKILCSLGHNSSAIGLYNDGGLIAGYEEERLTRIKADQRFPMNAIMQIFQNYNPANDDINELYISHWYDNFEFYNEAGGAIKYDRFNRQFVDMLMNKYKFRVYGLSEDFTHHDAHAWAAKSFYDYHKTYYKDDDLYVLVADGFGNRQEVLTLYKIIDNKPKMFFKQVGYEKSFGLLYQYATSFLGLKENQDEYKLLGAESLIKSYLSDQQIKELDKLIIEDVARKLGLFTGTRQVFDNDEKYINVDGLSQFKRLLHSYFQTEICDVFASDEPGQTVAKQAIVAYYVQGVLERFMERFITKFNIKNLITVGGIFYNVKLNNAMLNKLDSLCVMPLAGDQGAAIGVYNYYNQTNMFKHYSNLFWGKREKKKLSPDNIKQKGVYIAYNKTDVVDFIVPRLLKNEIVQIVNGAMEFGPRALCNTTTFALPYTENVRLINQINNRNELMPMAPVMLEENLPFFFEEEQYKKVIGSLEYMIITLDYKKEVAENEQLLHQYRGIMHNYPLDVNKYSGRPQVIKNKKSYMYEVLKKLDNSGIKAIINTSYNVHGRPIVFSVDQALDDFKYQISMIDMYGMDAKISLLLSDV